MKWYIKHIVVLTFLFFSLRGFSQNRHWQYETVGAFGFSGSLTYIDWATIERINRVKVSGYLGANVTYMFKPQKLGLGLGVNVVNMGYTDVIGFRFSLDELKVRRNNLSLELPIFFNFQHKKFFLKTGFGLQYAIAQYNTFSRNINTANLDIKDNQKFNMPVFIGLGLDVVKKEKLRSGLFVEFRANTIQSEMGQSFRLNYNLYALLIGWRVAFSKYKE